MLDVSICRQGKVRKLPRSLEITREFLTKWISEYRCCWFCECFLRSSPTGTDKVSIYSPTQNVQTIAACRHILSRPTLSRRALLRHYPLHCGFMCRLFSYFTIWRFTSPRAALRRRGGSCNASCPMKLGRCRQFLVVPCCSCRINVSNCLFFLFISLIDSHRSGKLTW